MLATDGPWLTVSAWLSVTAWLAVSEWPVMLDSEVMLEVVSALPQPALPPMPTPPGWIPPRRPQSKLSEWLLPAPCAPTCPEVSDEAVPLLTPRPTAGAGP